MRIFLEAWHVHSDLCINIITFLDYYAISGITSDFSTPQGGTFGMLITMKKEEELCTKLMASNLLLLCRE